jgi:hypothetical protein
MESCIDATNWPERRCFYMTRSKWFLHDDRTLEVRDLRSMTSLQIWIYENDRPIGLHSVVRLAEASAGLAAGRDVLGRAMDGAIADVQAGRFVLDQPTPVALAAR